MIQIILIGLVAGTELMYFSHVHRGNDYLVKGDLDLAMIDFNASITAKPDLPYYYNSRGVLHKMRQELKVITRLFQKY